MQTREMLSPSLIIGTFSLLSGLKMVWAARPTRPPPGMRMGGRLLNPRHEPVIPGPLLLRAGQHQGGGGVMRLWGRVSKRTISHNPTTLTPVAWRVPLSCRVFPTGVRMAAAPARRPLKDQLPRALERV